MEKSTVVRVGSRKSQLALIQTETVIKSLKLHHPHLEFEIITMSTTGDNILDKALSKIGEKSLFTKELEVALAKREVDFVVHSLKDLPTTLPPGMMIGAVCRREDPSDAVVMHPKYHDIISLEQLPNDSVIGTSSLRRIAQLQRRYPHLKYQSIRGNLNTRLRKLDEDNAYSAIILATAGITRLGLKDRITQKLPSDVCMHAVGQGALAVEVREDDTETHNLISCINDNDTALCCIAERAFMKTLEGGCSVPVAVHSSITHGKIVLSGGVFSLDGTECVVGTHSIVEKDGGATRYSENGMKLPNMFCGISIHSVPDSDLRTAEQTGVQLAEQLQKQGAQEILNNVRQFNVSL